ncbi:MAG: DNA methyltransferase [Bdellovibrionaceae bacterium]|nr:DNA methyltransferase [Pseudobdellovibrionaceae bacterium]
MSLQIFNEDFLSGVNRLDDRSIDLVVADPPYSLGKDYGNDSDKKSPKEFLNWTRKWITAVEPKIKETGSLYIYLLPGDLLLKYFLLLKQSF